MEFPKGYIVIRKTKKGKKRYQYRIKQGRKSNGKVNWVATKGGFNRRTECEMAMTKVINEIDHSRIFL